MTEAEKKKYGRRELLELLEEKEEEVERLNRALADMEKKLSDRTIRIGQAGSIAEASLAVSGIFEAAEKAASQYLENVERLSGEQQEVCREMEQKSKKEAEAAIKNAQQRSDEILKTAHEESETLLSNARKLEEDTRNRCEQMLSDARKEADAYWEKVTAQMEQYCQAREGLKELLAASPAGWNCYRMRYGVEEYAVTSDYTYTHYALLPGVTAKSWVIPCGGGWHVRVHRIVTDRAIDTADGGFALPVEQPFTLLPNGKDGKLLPGKEEAVSGGIGAFLSWGASAACALDGGEPCRCEMVRTFPNTNLMAPLCAVPTVITSLRPGNYLLIHAFFGDAGGKAEAALAIPPKASLEPVIAIHKMDGTLVNIDTAD